MQMHAYYNLDGLVMLTRLISHPITTFLLTNQLSWNNIKPSMIDILFKCT